MSDVDKKRPLPGISSS